MKKFSMSYENIEKSLKAISSLNDTYKLSMALATKANILSKQGKLIDAKNIYREALNLAIQYSERLLMLRCFVGLASIYIEEFDWEKATDYLQKAGAIIIDVNTPTEAKELELLQSKIPNTKILTNTPHFKINRNIGIFHFGWCFL